MRIRMVCAGLLAALPLAAVAGPAAIAGPAATSAQAAAALPPDLQALEQKLTQLPVSSETFTSGYMIGSPSAAEGGFHLGLQYEITGEAVLSPLQANLTVKIGNRTTSERLIGESLYVDEPRLSSLDKGKPWVKIEHETLQKVVQFNPSGSPQGEGAGAAGAFTNLLGIVNGALSIKEVGPANADSQPVTEFTAQLEPKVLLGVFTKQEYETLDFFGKPSVELQLFMASTGVPVRTKLALNVNGLEAGAAVDILAINKPVTVPMPPADQTITQAERKAFSKIEDKRKLAKRKAKGRAKRRRDRAKRRAKRHAKHHGKGHAKK